MDRVYILHKRIICAREEDITTGRSGPLLVGVLLLCKRSAINHPIYPAWHDTTTNTTPPPTAAAAACCYNDPIVHLFMYLIGEQKFIHKTNCVDCTTESGSGRGGEGDHHADSNHLYYIYRCGGGWQRGM